MPQPPWAGGEINRGEITAEDLEDIYEYLAMQEQMGEETENNQRGNWGADDTTSDGLQDRPESDLWRAILGNHISEAREVSEQNNDETDQERVNAVDVIRDNRVADTNFVNKVLFGVITENEVIDADTYTLLKASSELYINSPETELHGEDMRMLNKIKTELYRREIPRDDFPSVEGPNITNALS